MKISTELRRESTSHLDGGLAVLTDDLMSAGARLGRTLRIIALVGGALVIAVVTFAGVAAYQIMTSSEVKMIAQAARDKAHSTALDAASAAKCDRLISEARAKGQFLPACAANRPPQAAGSALETEKVIGTLVKAAVD